MGTIKLAGGRAGQQVCRFIASGEFGADGRDKVRQALASAAAAGWRRVEIDFAGVTWVDARAVRMLADCRYHAAQHGCELSFVNLAPRPRRTVENIDGTGYV